MVIYKYPLDVTGEQAINMPMGAEIRHVGDQHGVLTLWAEVNPNLPNRTKVIIVRGTGQDFPPDKRDVFLGTVIMGVFVWHVFERRSS